MHVQSICDALEIPHVETRWDFQLQRDDLSINLYPRPPVLARAYTDLVKAWGWRHFAIVYEDNEGTCPRRTSSRELAGERFSTPTPTRLILRMCAQCALRSLRAHPFFFFLPGSSSASPPCPSTSSSSFSCLVSNLLRASRHPILSGHSLSHCERSSHPAAPHPLTAPVPSQLSTDVCLMRGRAQQSENEQRSHDRPRSAAQQYALASSRRASCFLFHFFFFISFCSHAFCSHLRFQACPAPGVRTGRQRAHPRSFAVSSLKRPASSRELRRERLVSRFPRRRPRLTASRGKNDKSSPGLAARTSC